MNSPAYDKGGFVLHGIPGRAGTLKTDEAAPSLEDKFNTQGIVLVYFLNV